MNNQTKISANKKKKLHKNIPKINKKILSLRNEGKKSEEFANQMLIFSMKILKRFLNPERYLNKNALIDLKMEELFNNEKSWIISAYEKRAEESRTQQAGKIRIEKARKAEINQYEKQSMIYAKQMIDTLKKEYETDDCGIEKDIGDWITDWALNETMSISVIEDCGYDCSTRGVETNKKYDIYAYQTVGHFLDEPNGQTIATYESGSGLCADIISTDFNYFVSELIEEWFYNEANKIELPKEIIRYVKDDFNELCCEELLDGIYWQIKLSEKSFIDLIRDHCTNEEWIKILTKNKMNQEMIKNFKQNYIC
jgi:sulfite reductase alpha subunit-like flavoprotein